MIALWARFPPLITTTMAVQRMRELVLYRSKGLIRLYIRDTRRPKGAKNFPYKGHYKNALHHKNAPPLVAENLKQWGGHSYNDPYTTLAREGRKIPD